MSNALKSYFAKGKKANTNPNSVQVYEDRMKVVIPEIVSDMRKNERRLADLRNAPSVRNSDKKPSAVKKDGPKR